MVCTYTRALGFDGYIFAGFAFVAPVAKNLKVRFRMLPAIDEGDDMIRLPLVSGAKLSAT